MAPFVEAIIEVMWVQGWIAETTGCRVATTLPGAGLYGAEPLLGLVCAALSLLCSACVAAIIVSRRFHPAPSPQGLKLPSACHFAALMFAVPAAVIEVVYLMTRMTCLAIDVLRGFPSVGLQEGSQTLHGLWALGLLSASCAVASRSIGHPSLYTCQLWISSALVIRASLLIPPYQSSDSGIHVRSSCTLLLSCALALVLLGASVLSHRAEKLGQAKAGASQASFPHRRQGRMTGPEVCPTARPGWPGFRPSCAAIALAVILLVAHHLAVPITPRGLGFRLEMLATASAAVIAAGACFLLLAREHSRGLAEAAFGLATLAICAVAVFFVPSHPTALAERYPLIFCAIIVGLSVAAASWTWLTGYWKRRQDDLVEENVPALTRRLASCATRYSFLSAAMGVTVAALLAVWPRLQSIAAMDDDFGRVGAGFAANLFLLLVVLHGARKLRRPTFHVLTGLATLTTAGFLVVRLLPFAGHIR